MLYFSHVKFPFHGHLRLRLGNVNKFPFLSTCKLNSNLSARLILYSCTYPFLDHPSLNRTKTCRTVPKKVHNPLKQSPSIIKSAIFLPDVPLLSPMTDRAQTVSMIHNDSHCNQHDFIYLWTNKSESLSKQAYFFKFSVVF